MAGPDEEGFYRHSKSPPVIQIAPFRPLRYNPREISFISRVVAPPYDLLSETDAEELRERDPHNIVRLTLSKDSRHERTEHAYHQAAETLTRWREENVLIREPEHAIYLCEESFALGGTDYVRRGFLSTTLLEDFGSGRILPHEHTTPGPIHDRLQLMEACRANLSPVFGIFSDTDGQIDRRLERLGDDSPLYEFCSPEDVCYRVWRIAEPGEVRDLAGLLRNELLLIADGHHRYETAVAYRDKHRSVEGPPGSAPEDFLLTFCVSAHNPGLCVLPTHRLVRAEAAFDPEWLARSMANRYNVEDLHVGSPEQLEEIVTSWQPEESIIGCYMAGNRMVLIRPGEEEFLAPESVPGPPVLRKLPVTVLHHNILRPFFDIPVEVEKAGERLEFTVDPDRLYWAVEGGRFDAAFLLPPISPATLAGVARSGHRMPPKTTWFYPKIPSGLVLYPFENGENLPRLAHD